MPVRARPSTEPLADRKATPRSPSTRAVPSRATSASKSVPTEAAGPLRGPVAKPPGAVEDEQSAPVAEQDPPVPEPAQARAAQHALGRRRAAGLRRPAGMHRRRLGAGQGEDGRERDRRPHGGRSLLLPDRALRRPARGGRALPRRLERGTAAGALLYRALRDDVRPRYAAVSARTAGGVLLVGRLLDERALELFATRQGFIAARARRRPRRRPLVEPADVPARHPGPRRARPRRAL